MPWISPFARHKRSMIPYTYSRRQSWELRQKKNAPTIIIQQRSWISRDSDLVTRAKGIVTIIQTMKTIDRIKTEAVGNLWWWITGHRDLGSKEIQWASLAKPILKLFFLVWAIFKVIIEFFMIWPLFYGAFGLFVSWPQGMWDLSSLTRDQTCTLCIGRWSLNHWTTKEVPKSILFFKKISKFDGLSYTISSELFQKRRRVQVKHKWLGEHRLWGQNTQATFQVGHYLLCILVTWLKLSFSFLICKVGIGTGHHGAGNRTPVFQGHGKVWIYNSAQQTTLHKHQDWLKGSKSIPHLEHKTSLKSMDLSVFPRREILWNEGLHNITGHGWVIRSWVS